MRTQTAAAIVAGGQARRFRGCDKSRLLVEGRSIISRQLAVLQHVASEIFIVANDAERYADLHLAVHPDRVAGAGALGGVYTALSVAAADRVIVVACDLPFLDAGVLARLVELASGHDAAWVTSPRGPEPLLACYTRSAAPVLRREIDAGRLRASDSGSVLRIAALDADALARFGPVDRLLANVNSPDDLLRWTMPGDDPEGRK